MWKVFGINTIKRVPDCKSFEVFVYYMSHPTASSVKMESNLHKSYNYNQKFCCAVFCRAKILHFVQNDKVTVEWETNRRGWNPAPTV